MNREGKSIKKHTFFYIWLISMAIWTILLLLLMPIEKKDYGILVMTVPFLGGLSTLVIFFAYAGILGIRVREKQKILSHQDQVRGITRFSDLVHREGLSVPSGCECTAIVSPQGLTVSLAGREFYLTLDRITEADYQYHEDERLDVTDNYNRYAGRTVYDQGGKAVGRMPETQRFETRTVTIGYAIISYHDSHGQFRTFTLKDKYANDSACKSLVSLLDSKIIHRVNRVVL